MAGCSCASVYTHISPEGIVEPIKVSSVSLADLQGFQFRKSLQSQNLPIGKLAIHHLDRSQVFHPKYIVNAIRSQGVTAA